jgi:hypothetical protein
VGALVPLFSIPSRVSWGIGEIPDLPRFARWLDEAGCDFVQLLPVNEMADGLAQKERYRTVLNMVADEKVALRLVAEILALGAVAEGSARLVEHVLGELLKKGANPR